MAEKEPSIAYICGNEQYLSQFEANLFDLVTFAGSLSYSKNQTLRTELKRICRAGANLVIYDFEVLFGNFFQTVELNLIPLESSGYDHSINISDWMEFKEEVVRKEQISLNISEVELAHLILSHSTWHKELIDLFGVQKPFDRLTSYLRSKGKDFQLPVNIFYSRYLA